MPISTKYRRLVHRLAFALLRGLGVVGRGVMAVGRALAPTARVIGQILTRFLILPVYKLAVMAQIRLARLLLSARGLFFLIFTNRYVFHAVILLLSLATIATQWQTNRATAMETGQNSLLYALVTDDKDETVQEEVRPELLAKNNNYLGSETIQALPDIDYDYEGTDQPLADLTVPGSIAVQPGDEPGAPGDQAIKRTKTEIYAVESGDTVASIARKFGVNVGTVVWANNLGTNATIRPGDKLKIPAISGVLVAIKKGDTVEKLAKKYSVNAEDIFTTNHITPSSNLALGEELVIPGATPLPVPVPVAVRGRTPSTVRPGVPKTTIRNKSFDQYQELVDTKSDDRAKPEDVESTTVAAGKLLWPTKQHVITQYYGWAHTGVDLDGDYVDPIYAAADGVVETAGWNSGGYGLMIMVDHDALNMKTRYGHASKLFVKVGDVVKRGQVIAMVGTTGRSTGTHLHFEVYKNGKRTNPLAYIR